MAIQYKIGVKVRAKTSRYEGRDDGTVIATREAGTIIGVEHGTRITGGHSCNDQGKGGRCWWYQTNEIDPIRKVIKKIIKKKVVKDNPDDINIHGII